MWPEVGAMKSACDTRTSTARRNGRRSSSFSQTPPLSSSCCYQNSA